MGQNSPVSSGAFTAFNLLQLQAWTPQQAPSRTPGHVGKVARSSGRETVRDACAGRCEGGGWVWRWHVQCTPNADMQCWPRPMAGLALRLRCSTYFRLSKSWSTTCRGAHVRGIHFWEGSASPDRGQTSFQCLGLFHRKTPNQYTHFDLILAPIRAKPPSHPSGSCTGLKSVGVGY